MKERVDEDKKEIIDPLGIQLRRRLANNLQNSYLKGVNYVINKNITGKYLHPSAFLGEYDIQNWNSHIYQLCDQQYQKQILGQLCIPEIK